MKRPYRSLGWTRRSNGAYAEFRRYHLVDDGGSWVGRDQLLHPGAVVVLPVFDDAIVLVEQWRHAVDGPSLEAPAGLLEPGEAPEESAARECVEETGYRPGTLTALGRWWASPGISDERIHGFVATDLEYVGRAPDGLEEWTAEVVRLPVAEALDAVSDGRISDLKTVALLGFAAGVREWPGT